LKKVLAVLLLVPRRHALSRQLALLPHRRKAGAQPECQARPKQEAPGVQPDNDIGLLAHLQDVQFECPYQGCVQFYVGEDGHDVFEEDARGGEVGELAERGLEAGLEVGEFI
jgi:hypothetical protein